MLFIYQFRVHPETPYETLAVSGSGFATSKRGIFRPGKQIEGLRGGVHRYRLAGRVPLPQDGKELSQDKKSGRN